MITSHLTRSQRCTSSPDVLQDKPPSAEGRRLGGSPTPSGPANDSGAASGSQRPRPVPARRVPKPAPQRQLGIRDPSPPQPGASTTAQAAPSAPAWEPMITDEQQMAAATLLSTDEGQAAASTMVKLLRNILGHPDELKYRQLRQCAHCAHCV